MSSVTRALKVSQNEQNCSRPFAMGLIRLSRSANCVKTNIRARFAQNWDGSSSGAIRSCLITFFAGNEEQHSGSSASLDCYLDQCTEVHAEVFIEESCGFRTDNRETPEGDTAKSGCYQMDAPQFLKT